MTQRKQVALKTVETLPTDAVAFTIAAEPLIGAHDDTDLLCGGCGKHLRSINSATSYPAGYIICGACSAKNRLLSQG